MRIIIIILQIIFNLSKSADGLFAIVPYYIKILDKNDHAPRNKSMWTTTICKEHFDDSKRNITVITAEDLDTPQNGAPFVFEMLDNSDFQLEPGWLISFIYQIFHQIFSSYSRFSSCVFLQK